MLMKLPLAFIAGLKICEVSLEKAVVSIPFTFLNKNPFKSIYFAALSMAAELSTGILALSAIADTQKSVSMLVVSMKADFRKKAISKVFFTCTEGSEIVDAINKCIELNESRSVTVKSTGLDKSGNEIAAFEFSWAFKLRTSDSGK